MVMKVSRSYIYLGICLMLEFSTFAESGILSKKTIYIPSFKYEMCKFNVKNKRFPIWFRDLDIMATSYGDIDFTGTFITSANLTSPLKAVVNLKRKFLGVEVKIPCIKNFGSCTYEDLCKYGYTECPPVLEEHEVPCKCPIEPGVYNIPGIQFKEMAKSRWGFLLAGDYTAVIKLYQGPRLLTCFHVKFSLS